MKPTALTAVLLGLAISGCTSMPGMQFGLQGSDEAVKSSLAPGAAEASLPFKTLLVDEGPGRWLAAGTDERLVLKSQAELDAMFARHARYVPAPAGPMRPVPGASVGPPMMRPPAGAPTPSPEAEPLPEVLTNLDFDRWQAIAFVDGAVDLSTSSRITAVVDRGDRLEVQTTRWVAPPNPASGPSPSSRVHIIALPRTDKPVTFTETDVLDGTAKEGEGGYGVAGGPTMNPKWRAVPNPDLTRELIEETYRRQYQGATFTKFSVEKRTIAWVRDNLMSDAVRSHYTPDSEVWVVEAEGNLPHGGPGGGMIGPSIGGTEARMSGFVALISVEAPFPHPFTMRSKVIPGEPGFGFEIEPKGDLYVGDTFRLVPRGKPPAGALTLSLTLNGAGPVVHKVSYADLATFGLVLDRTTLPSFTDAPVQKLAIKVEYEQGGMGTEVKLIRDRNAKPAPPMRVQGSGALSDYKVAEGENAWDAFARDIATTDWQGRDLQITSRTVRYADFEPEAPYNFELAPETSIRIYEIRGTFPTFLVPAPQSGQNQDEVMAPKRLVIAVTEQLPVTVVGLDAFRD